jgi:arylformamidase
VRPESDVQLPVLDPAEREREYSPSSCIGGNYQPFVAAYVEQSRRAFEEAKALGGRWLQARYGKQPAQRLDLCLPPRRARAGAGLLVFIHGGYWQELSARDSLFAAARCIERDLAFCAIDYTLAPAARVEGIVDECRRAMGWLFAHAPHLGLDPGRIVVAGSSAGAHLAAMVCLDPARAAGDALRPRAAVLVSGVYALEPLIGTTINQALGLDAQEARAASPACLPLDGFPSALVCWGEIETASFKRQSRGFADELRAAGTPCTTFEVPGRNHFDVILDLAEPSSVLGGHVLALFQA